MRTAAPWSGTNEGPRSRRRDGVPGNGRTIESVDALAYSLPTNASEPSEIHAVRSVAVIDDERPAFHQRIGHKAPIATIERIVAIVAENEVITGRNDERTPIIPRRVVPNRCVRRLHEIIALPAEILRRGIDVRLRVQHVGLGEEPAVTDQLPFSHLEGVAGQTHEALDEVLRRILGPLENNDVAILWFAQLGKSPVRERDFGAVSELVHQEEVPDEERTLHAAARDLERLDEEGAKEEKQQHRHGEDLRPLPQERQWPGAAIHATQRTNALLGSDRAGRRWYGSGSGGLCHAHTTT